MNKSDEEIGSLPVNLDPLLEFVGDMPVLILQHRTDAVRYILKGVDDGKITKEQADNIIAGKYAPHVDEDEVDPAKLLIKTMEDAKDTMKVLLEALREE